jgi:predicted DNA-binding protein with PD1-like motif
LEVGNESLFAAVITTGGMREFVFYTSNPQTVEVKLKKLRDTIESHTVQGTIKPDEDWGVYRQFV